VDEAVDILDDGRGSFAGGAGAAVGAVAAGAGGDRGGEDAPHGVGVGKIEIKADDPHRLSLPQSAGRRWPW
jgi:hypothetical protein